jgi:uncharacterized membrane protein YccC
LYGIMIVSRVTTLRTRLRTPVGQRRAQLAFSIRVTIAALTALALAQLLHLPLPAWAVLTAVIVRQMSVGRSLKATFDYLVGTLCGAIYGGTIALLVPHTSEFALLAVLALSVGPLAFTAAMNPRFSAAPITAIIVLLVPEITHGSPMASAFDRVIEVALGGVSASIISILCCQRAPIPWSFEAAAMTLGSSSTCWRRLGRKKHPICGGGI